jgi:DNA sulfur modification protein DndD
MEALRAEQSSVQHQLDRIRDIKLDNPGAIKRDYEELESKRNKLAINTTKIRQLETELRNHDTQQIKMDREELKIVDQEIGVKKSDIKRLEDDNIEQNRRLKNYNKQIQSMPQANLTAKQRVEVSSALVSIFNEAIHKFRSELKHSVEKFASETFLELINEAGYTGLNINDNYGLSIETELATVEERSAGQEQIVAFSLITALIKAAVHNGPVVTDTPFGRLDRKHRGNVLKHLPKTAEQVVFLVHDGEIRRDDEDLNKIKSMVVSSYEIERIDTDESRVKRIML